MASNPLLAPADASHAVMPKTMKLGGCFSPHLMWVVQKVDFMWEGCSDVDESGLSVPLPTACAAVAPTTLPAMGWGA